MAVQNDDARQELHALGFVDGHEGQQSLSVKFYLQLDTQKGNDMGNKRYGGMQLYACQQLHACKVLYDNAYTVIDDH